MTVGQREIERISMPEVFETTSVNPNFSLDDRFYGKGGIKVLHVSKNGKDCFEVKGRKQKVIFK